MNSFGKRRRVLRKNTCCLFIVCFAAASSAQPTAKRVGDYYAFSKNGIELTPYCYTEVSNFVEGIAWVNKGDLYGFINTNLDSITKFEYSDVSAFKNGFARVSKDSLFGFIDKRGNEICPLTYESVLPFNLDYASVNKGSGWNLIDTSGQEILTEECDYPPFLISDRFIIVVRNGKWGVIAPDNRVLYPFEYDLITPEGIGYKQDEKVYLGLM